MTREMDRQFVSYPKCGRSWLRYALRLVGLEALVRFHHDGCEFSDRSRPPLQLDFGLRAEACRPPARIVFLDRDPRDVIVSLYFQVKGRMRDVFQYEGDISAFIRDDYFGIENLCVYQRQWRRLCQEGAALRVTYEECHDDFGKVMRKIVDWYGFEVSDAALARARDESTFEKMRLVELAGTFCEPWLRPRNGELKVRRGIVGGYRDVLSPADLSVVEEARRRHDLV